MRRIKNRTERGQVECRCTNKDEVEMAKNKKIKNSSKIFIFSSIERKLTSWKDILAFVPDQKCRRASMSKARA